MISNDRACQLATLAMIATLGCGADDRGSQDGGGDGVGVEDGGGTTMGAKSDGSDDDDGGMPKEKLDTPDPDAPGTGGDECASVSEEAELEAAPADIIFIVDNSGSMVDEAQAVQANLNGFSTQIIDSGVDARVVLISSYSNWLINTGICVEPPLGSGGCPENDNNPPLYTHIADTIGSFDALRKVIEHHGQWGSIVRDDATLHFVVVTDDESDMSATDFDTELRALEPLHEDYVFHGIISMTDCEDAANIGSTYMELADATDGIASDLCDQNFQPVFDLLATEVISGSQLSCSWAIPDAEGQDVDPNEVNVEFDDGSGSVEVIGKVDSESACAGVDDGWHYDDPMNPTTVIACPQTCDRIQGVEMAKIDIAVGCETIPAG